MLGWVLLSIFVGIVVGFFAIIGVLEFRHGIRRARLGRIDEYERRLQQLHGLGGPAVGKLRELYERELDYQRGKLGLRR